MRLRLAYTNLKYFRACQINIKLDFPTEVYAL